MYTVMKHPRKIPYFVYLRRGMLVLCFSLILMGITVPSVFARSLSQSTIATTMDADSQPKLKNIILLGGAGPGGIAMVNESVGWTLTQTLKRTSDGGKTWKTVAQASGQEGVGLTNVLNGQVAWYQAYNKQTYATTALYRTNNGGQTWMRFAWVDPSQNLENMSIFDGQYAWVGTTDGNGASHLFLIGGASQNWHEVTQPGQSGANNFYFISQKVGWATTESPNDAGNSSSTLYMTSNGGQTWTQPHLSSPAGVPTTAVITHIQFLGFGNQKEGYLVAQFGDSATYMIYTSLVYRSLDGGKTWQPYGESKPENTRLVQIDNWHMVNSGFAFVLVGAGEELSSLQSGTWHIQNITLPGTPNSSPFLTVLNSRLMFVSTDSSDYTTQILYRSRDGGATWQEIASILNA